LSANKAREFPDIISLAGTNVLLISHFPGFSIAESLEDKVLSKHSILSGQTKDYGAYVMHRLLRGILLFGLTSAPAFADIALFQGTFAADDQVALFSITAATTEAITFQTYGYAGGTVNATAIPAGGFAPTAFLFDSLGDVLTLNAGTCSQVATDPVTGNCDDLYFQDTLGPGTYTLALAVYDNSPLGASASDGFAEDGSPGFTCLDAGVSGNFCDLSTALGASRTGDYAISVSGADSVTPVAAPEPSGMFLLLTGCALAALLRPRSNT
jgi:hypothetical protein